MALYRSTSSNTIFLLFILYYFFSLIVNTISHQQVLFLWFLQLTSDSSVPDILQVLQTLERLKTTLQLSILRYRTSKSIMLSKRLQNWYYRINNKFRLTQKVGFVRYLPLTVSNYRKRFCSIQLALMSHFMQQTEGNCSLYLS